MKKRTAIAAAVGVVLIVSAVTGALGMADYLAKAPHITLLDGASGEVGECLYIDDLAIVERAVDSGFYPLTQADCVAISDDLHTVQLLKAGEVEICIYAKGEIPEMVTKTVTIRVV